MTRPHVLLPAPMLDSVETALSSRFVVHHLRRQADPDAYVAAIGSGVRALAVSGAAGRIDASWFDRLPALEIVANFGVGYDAIDVAEATRRGIVVTNTPGVLNEEVADLTVGLLLATVRRIPQADRFVREGCWSTRSFPLSPTLRGRRVGILGLGAIGRAVARRLEAFDVPISYHGRSRQDVRYEYRPSAMALAEACDVLLVLVPGGAATTGLVDEAVLAALGTCGILINVSRGSTVDQTALVAALQRGTIAAAGLDVFADEPHVPPELCAMGNVVLLPHIGSATDQTRDAMGRLVVNNLASWFAGNGPVSPVC